MIKSKPLRWLLGISILLALILLVQWQLGWQSVLAAWAAVPLPVLAAAVVLFALSHGTRAVRIHRYVAASLGMSPLATLKLSLLHQGMNNFLPMRLGEGAFPILLRRYGGASLGAGFTQLAWLRVLDMIVMGAVAAAVALLWLPGMSWSTALGMVGLALGGVIALLIASKGAHWFDRLPTAAGRKIGKIVQVLLAAAPKGTAMRVELLAWTVLAWLAKLAALSLIITSVADIGLTTALSGALAGEVSGILPIHGVAGAGTYEAAFVAGAALGADALPNLLAAAVNTHLFVLSSTTLLALIVLPIRVQSSARGLEKKFDE